MAFEKGNKLSVGKGRPKGTESEATKLLKSKSKEMMELALEQARKGNTSVLLKLIDKISPSLQHTQLEADVYNEYSDYTDEELQERIDEIEQKLKSQKT